MKVLLINGSPRTNGNTYIALNEMIKVFANEDIETELIQVGNLAIRGCIACSSCKDNKKCCFDDIVNEIAAKLTDYDGIVVGSPVYYASANATLVALLDRLFCSTAHINKNMKVGANIVVARRGGASSTFDQLNKYFAISGMPIAPSQYWNSVHGNSIGEASTDYEGLQTMRSLAKNMSFMIKSLALGKEKYGLPEIENKIKTNFVR